MKLKHIIISCVIFALSNFAHAEPAFFLGAAYSFGPDLTISKLGDFGVTAKILTSRDQDNVVGAAGITFYPTATQKFGADLGIGYQGDHIAGIVGYDLLQKSVVLSGGYSSTYSDNQQYWRDHNCGNNRH